jgi:predicted O-methyltransferase YrrM
MTTRFFSDTAMRSNAQVYSCEIDEEHFKIAKRTVGHLHNVHLHHGNSVEFLLSLSTIIYDNVNFVYLDAHWHDYLPLRDELSILKEWANTIVMIDDFKVPFDHGFGWDRYDEQREICMQYVDAVIPDKPIFFPGYSARREGPVARGYCVIPMSNTVGAALEEIKLLRKYVR